MSITLAQKGDTVTKEFQVKRADHGPSSGHYGGVAFYSEDNPRVGQYGVDVEGAIGAMLPDGAQIRVTIEVIEEGTGQRRTNRWHDRDEEAVARGGHGLRTPWCDDCTAGRYHR